IVLSLRAGVVYGRLEVEWEHVGEVRVGESELLEFVRLIVDGVARAGGQMQVVHQLVLALEKSCLAVTAEILDVHFMHVQVPRRQRRERSESRKRREGESNRKHPGGISAHTAVLA